MTRAFNFCAGPAAFPEEVLKELQEETLDYKNHGLAVMEMSHRSKEFVSIAEQAKQDLIDLLSIPDEYDVLFIQGGASLQFSMIPMNLGNKNQKLDYLEVGSWSKKAIAEAKKFHEVNIAASSKDISFKKYPSIKDWNVIEDSSYIHMVMNETIEGVACRSFDDLPEKVIVSDCSSNILSEPLDIKKFGLIYAGAQKNIGPAGLAIVIIRKDLIQKRDDLPALMSYQTYADSESMYNTPPTFSWYLSGKVFSWLKRKGGLKSIEEINLRKAKKLYDYIDKSDFYYNDVSIESRSIMNVPFLLNDDSLNDSFLKESEKEGLLNLAGHRSVGGMRASIYNAVPEEAIDALVSFMDVFVSKYG